MIDGGTAYRIILGGEKAGGAVVKIKEDHGELELLFVAPEHHSKGIGYAAWCEIEKMYPDVRVWETYTPYFETRNIHFYVNRCGFQIVEFFNEFHPVADDSGISDEDNEGVFRFVKEIL